MKIRFLFYFLSMSLSALIIVSIEQDVLSCSLPLKLQNLLFRFVNLSFYGGNPCFCFLKAIFFEGGIHGSAGQVRNSLLSVTLMCRCARWLEPLPEGGG